MILICLHCKILQEIEFFFPTASNRKPLKTTATLQRCALCIIKPHAIKDGKFGDIISMIHECGFNITALKMCYLDRANCEEFYEIYKGVVPEYVVSLFFLFYFQIFCKFNIFFSK